MAQVSVLEDIDDSETTHIHRRIIRSKSSLWDIYSRLYRDFASHTRDLPPGTIVEIGAGTGFLKEFVPQAVTTDICYLPWVDVVCNAMALPFPDASLSAIYLRGVLHHIPEPRKFFGEVTRTLKPGGMLIMVEPHNTPWAGFVCKHFHHEPYDPTTGWELSESGRLTGANLAMPWIIFFRDRQQFGREFPRLCVTQILSQDILQYFLSGGFRYRPFVPRFLWWAVRLTEYLLSPLLPWLGTLMVVKVRKSDAALT